MRVAPAPALRHEVEEPGLTEEDGPTMLPAFSFDRAVAGQCASDVVTGIEPRSSENHVLVPWLVRALQQAAGMEAEGAEVGARLRAMAAAAGRVTVHDGGGQVPAATVEDCPIRAVRVVYGQLARRYDRVQAAAAEVPEWMMTEVARARAAGEAGWVERARRGFDEMRGAAQRHEWEQLAVAPTGEGAYRVVSEAMRPLQLKFVVEMELPPATAGAEATAVAASIQLRAARRGAAAERALWVEVCTGELERRQRYDEARHCWMPSWWATGFYRDGSAPVRVWRGEEAMVRQVAEAVEVREKRGRERERHHEHERRPPARRPLRTVGHRVLVQE